MNTSHDVAGPLSLSTALGLAGVPWVSNLELGLRIAALVLSILASWFAIRHYRKK